MTSDNVDNKTIEESLVSSIHLFIIFCELEHKFKINGLTNSFLENVIRSTVSFYDVATIEPFRNQL